MQLNSRLKRDNYTSEAGHFLFSGWRRKLGIAALIADPSMRRRDERLKGQGKHKAKSDPLALKRPDPAAQFIHDLQTSSCICPAGRRLYSKAAKCRMGGRIAHKFTGTIASCGECGKRAKCLRHPERTKVRQVSISAKNQRSLNGTEGPTGRRWARGTAPVTRPSLPPP